MRQVRILVLWILVFLFAGGCGFGNKPVTDRALSRGPVPQYDDTLITVGFIQTGKESDWRDANTQDYFRVFTEANGYRFLYIDGNSRPERQVKAMHDLVRQQVDYIVLDPIVEAGWTEALREARDAGIPVIVTDRRVDAEDSLYTCWVGSDFEEEGRKAGRWLAQYLEAAGRAAGSINIVILEGTPGSSATLGRAAGLDEIVSTHPEWHVAASAVANFTQGEGQTVMQALIDQMGSFDVLIAHNDNMMFGAMKAMACSNIAFGPDGDVITISFDALRQAFDEMIAGRLHATVACNPLLAELTDRIIRRLEAGEPVEKVYYSEESIFTYKNAAASLPGRAY